MREVRIPCRADQGLFKDELLVTITSRDGDRQFFISKHLFTPDNLSAELPITGTTLGWVLAESGVEMVVSIPGEPADLHASRVLIAA